MALFTGMDINASGMSAQRLRMDVISENIANVDTPGYKRQDVSFESVLSAAVAKGSSLSNNLTKTVRDINYNHVKPTVYTDNAELSYRIDGNNVDIDVEQIELASNQLYYEAVTDSMKMEFDRFKAALSTK